MALVPIDLCKFGRNPTRFDRVTAVSSIVGTLQVNFATLIWHLPTTEAPSPIERPSYLSTCPSLVKMQPDLSELQLFQVLWEYCIVARTMHFTQTLQPADNGHPVPSYVYTLPWLVLCLPSSIPHVKPMEGNVACCSKLQGIAELQCQKFCGPSAW